MTITEVPIIPIRSTKAIDCLYPISIFKTLEDFEDILRQEICNEFDDQVLKEIDLNKFKKFVEIYYQTQKYFVVSEMCVYFGINFGVRSRNKEVIDKVSAFLKGEDLIPVHVSNFRDFQDFRECLRKEIYKLFDDEVLGKVTLAKFEEFTKWFYQEGIIFSPENVKFYFKSFLEDKPWEK